MKFHLILRNKEFKMKKALKKQVGGSHYKDMVIQPIEFTHKNNLNFCQGNIIKYTCRYKEKNGIEDLKKESEGEFRKNVALKVHYKGDIVKVNLDKLKEYSITLEKFINYLKQFLSS